LPNFIVNHSTYAYNIAWPFIDMCERFVGKFWGHY